MKWDLPVYFIRLVFPQADDRAAKLQSELLEWRKKGLALELKLKEETEEKLVVQRLLELER